MAAKDDSYIMNNKNDEAPVSLDIFKGISFTQPVVSKKEFAKHYEEYVRRCSGTR